MKEKAETIFLHSVSSVHFLTMSIDSGFCTQAQKTSLFSCWKPWTHGSRSLRSLNGLQQCLPSYVMNRILEFLNYAIFSAVSTNWHCTGYSCSPLPGEHTPHRTFNRTRVRSKLFLFDHHEIKISSQEIRVLRSRLSYIERVSRVPGSHTWAYARIHLNHALRLFFKLSKVTMKALVLNL